MALARVDHGQPGAAEHVEHATGRRDRAPERRDVVAEHLAESAALDEIPLHVDDEQRGLRGVERELVGLGVDGQDAARPGHDPCRVIRRRLR